MRALIKKSPERGLWMEDVPTPSYGNDDVLIRIKKTAICGTDLHIYKWDEWSQKNIKTPMVIGHEFCGEIVACGSLVKGFSVGDRVSGEGHLVCGHCRNCRGGHQHLCPHTKGIGVNIQGAFAEYLSLPASNLFKIDDSISDDLASIFDPYGNAAHTTLSFNLVGEDVLITGAGPIGLMAVAIAKHVGARHVVITDVNEYRLSLAKQMGATLAVNPNVISLQEVMKQLKMEDGFNVGLEMSGHPQALVDMIDVMNNGGHIGLLGIFPKPVAIDWSKVSFKGLFLKGIYGREMYETWYKMSSMLQSGLNLAKVITHRLPANEFLNGFHLLEKGEACKVVLDWS